MARSDEGDDSAVDVGDADSVDDAPPTERLPVGDPPTWLQSLGAALAAGMLGAVLLGVGEFLATTMIYGIAGYRAHWPWVLYGAYAGKMIATHLLVWPVLMLASGVVYQVFARKRGRAAPQPFFLGWCLLLAGGVVLPLDLELAHKTNAGYYIVGYAILLYLAVMVYFGGRFVRRKMGARRFGCGYWGATGLALIVALVSVACLLATSVGRPANFRLADASPADRRSERPHVLWIVMDTVRADRLSVYGYEHDTTPFMKKWAEQSIVFDRPVANGMWTVPTHASMFTGLPSRQHGQGHKAIWLDDEFVTAAERLDAAGYATAFFSNNPLVSERYNVTQGFDQSVVVWHAQQATRFSLEYLCLAWGLPPIAPWLDFDFGAALTNEMVAGWLDDHASEPTLVFINYFEAHLPYRVPRRYREMFMTGQQVRLSYELQFARYGDMTDWVNNRANIDGYEFLSKLEIETMVAMYEASLRYLDDRIGELVDAYRQRGLLDNTLVVIAADHGEYLNTHGMWSHHFLTFDDLTRVPMLIREPGRAEGVRVAAPAQLTDLYATVVRAALGDGAFEPRENSRDLFDLAESPEMSRLAVIECYGPEPSAAERLRRKTDAELRHRPVAQIAAVGERYKYTRSEDGRRELYDLAEDPGELTNLISSHRAIANRMEAFLDGWRLRVPEYVAKERPQGAPDALETLKALGYVAGDESGD